MRLRSADPDAAQRRFLERAKADADRPQDFLFGQLADGGPVLLAFVLAADLGPPWRPIVVLVFLAVVPGASLVPLIGIPDFAVQLTLVVPVSFALVALTSAALFYPRLWSPGRELVFISMLCLVGHVLQWIEAWKSTIIAGGAL